MLPNAFSMASRKWREKALAEISRSDYGKLSEANEKGSGRADGVRNSNFGEIKLLIDLADKCSSQLKIK